MEYYLALKRKEILPQNELLRFVLSETGQSQKNDYCYDSTYIWAAVTKYHRQDFFPTQTGF